MMSLVRHAHYSAWHKASVCVILNEHPDGSAFVCMLGGNCFVPLVLILSFGSNHNGLIFLRSILQFINQLSLILTALQEKVDSIMPIVQKW